MGQVALGFRSLVVKLAVFFVLASLLAWALGGTLWPRAEIVDYEGQTIGDQTWFWRLLAGGKERGRARWQLMVTVPGEPPVPVDDRIWDAVAGPLLAGGTIYFAGRDGADGTWGVETVDGASKLVVPDRLAVERQLARLEAGLPLQDAATITRQRGFVLEPAGTEADQDNRTANTDASSPETPGGG